MIIVNFRKGFTTGLLVLSVLACGVSAAQENQAPSAAPKTDSKLAADWEKVIPRLEYEGLPLDEVVRDLRKHFPRVNFIVPQSASTAPVGEVTLSSVTLCDILKAIELSSEGRIVPSVAGTGGAFAPGMPAAVDPLTGAPVPSARSNIVYFQHQPNLGLAGPPSPIECRAFSLARYLQGRTGAARDEAIKSLEEAITMALAMLKQADTQVEKPQFSIHAETSLFIAVGRVKELAVVAQIVSEMQSVPPMLAPQSYGTPDAGKKR